MRSHSRQDDTIAEINITPLTDVLLVLLIIVMVTASFIAKTGININMPKSTQKTELPVTPIALTVQSDGKIYLGSIPDDWSTLPDHLKDLANSGSSKSIIIRGDMKSSYQDIFRAIDVAKGAGFEKVILGAERKN